MSSVTITNVYVNAVPTGGTIAKAGDRIFMLLFFQGVFITQGASNVKIFDRATGLLELDLRSLIRAGSSGAKTAILNRAGSGGSLNLAQRVLLEAPRDFTPSVSDGRLDRVTTAGEASGEAHYMLSQGLYSFPFLDGQKDIELNTGDAGDAFHTRLVTRLGNAFTYVNGPKVTLLNPDFGSDTDVITVTGTGFGPSAVGLSATLDGVAVDALTYISPISFTFEVPHLTSGVGVKTFSVSTVAGGTSKYFNAFNYTGSVVITSVTPARFPQLKATDIAIVGVSFETGSTVSIIDVATGAVNACTAVLVTGTTLITCRVPALRAGNKVLKVQTPNNGAAFKSVYYFKILSLHGAGVVVKFGTTQPATPDAAHTVSTHVVLADLSADQALFRRPSDYDASLTGLPWTKNHYHQVFIGTDAIRDSMNSSHNEAGDSLISMPGMRGAVRSTNQIAISEPVGTIERVTLRAHAGVPLTAWQVLHTPVEVDGDGNTVQPVRGNTGFVSVGLGFDDTNVYGLVKYERSIPNGLTVFVATLESYTFEPDAAALPDLDQPDFANPYTLGSHDAAPYVQTRSNMLRELAIYEAEHDLRSGGHRVPLSRFAGFATELDDFATAPDNTTDTLVVLVGTISTSKLYLQPSLVGDAGAGIAEASLIFSPTKVYIGIRSVTIGSTRNFRVVLYSVTDS